MDCGSGKLADDCGGCGGEREGCGGECRWLEGADFCVHAVGRVIIIGPVSDRLSSISS